MSNLIDLQDLLSREVETIASDVAEESVFMSVTKKTPLPLGGKSFTSIGGIQAGIVSTRGGAKRVAEPVTTQVQMIPMEFAIIVPFAESLLTSLPEAALQIRRDAVQALSNAFDYAVREGEDEFGVPVNAGFSSFGDFSDNPISTSGELMKIIYSLGADSHIVISTGLFGELLSRENQFGTPTFKIDPVTSKTGFIHGVPYTIFESPDTVAFVGGFNKYALAGRVGNINFKILDQASVPINGELTSLALHDLAAFRVSAEFGYAITDKTKFNTFSLAPEAPEAP